MTSFPTTLQRVQGLNSRAMLPDLLVMLGDNFVRWRFCRFPQQTQYDSTPPWNLHYLPNHMKTSSIYLFNKQIMFRISIQPCDAFDAKDSLCH